MMKPDCGPGLVPGWALTPDAPKFQNKIEAVPKPTGFWRKLNSQFE
jgi:hypothetical protein